MDNSSEREELPGTEFIGRALYGKKKSEVFSERGLVKWEQFYDKRYETDLSVDRLGNGQINQRHIDYLLPRAEARDKCFRGWAQIEVAKMQRKKLNLSVYASPVVSDDSLKANKHHAERDRSNFRGVVAGQDMAAILATALAHLAADYDVIPSPSAAAEDQQGK